MIGSSGTAIFGCHPPCVAVSEQQLGDDVPFKKISKNRYRSPSGRVYTKSQVERYYARGKRWR